MCDFCTPSTPITRRRFLQLGIGAGVGALLVACASEQVTPAGPTLAATLAATSSPVMMADLAGRVASTTDTSFVLAAPVGSQSLSLAKDFQLLDSNGQPAGNQPPPAGSSVQVWLRGAEVETAQLLPPIAATNDIPEGLAQPQPTGEVVTLGPISMITRAGWGAAGRQFSPAGESGLYDPQGNPTGWLEYPPPLADQLQALAVHHSALEFYHGPQPIQRMHMLGRGFADIGYHYLIDGLGQVYEGRPVGVRGAHVAGRNTGVVGVCLLGNFEEVGPVGAQINTLKQLVATLRDTYQLSYLAGHRDYQPGETVCPGASIGPLIPNLAAEMGMISGTLPA